MLLISFVKYQNASFTTDLMMYVELIGRGLQPAVHAIEVLMKTPLSETNPKMGSMYES